MAHPFEILVEQESVPDEDEPAYMTDGQRAAVTLLQEDIEPIYERILTAVAAHIAEEQRQRAARYHEPSPIDQIHNQALGLTLEPGEFDEADYLKRPDWWVEDEEDDDELDEYAIRTKDTFTLRRARVTIDVYQDLAHIIFEGDCAWDEEHGLGILYHPEQDLIFGRSGMEA